MIESRACAVVRGTKLSKSMAIAQAVLVLLINLVTIVIFSGNAISLVLVAAAAVEVRCAAPPTSMAIARWPALRESARRENPELVLLERFIDQLEESTGFTPSANGPEPRRYRLR